MATRQLVDSLRVGVRFARDDASLVPSRLETATALRAAPLRWHRGARRAPTAAPPVPTHRVLSAQLTHRVVERSTSTARPRQAHSRSQALAPSSISMSLQLKCKIVWHCSGRYSTPSTAPCANLTVTQAIAPFWGVYSYSMQRVLARDYKPGHLS